MTMMNNYLFSGRHPEYIANERAWRRSRDAYSGGAAYIDAALIRHVSEIPVEFEERRRRAYYFNYPRAIAQRITQYALAVEPIRRNAVPELVEDWSRSGLRTNEVMRQLSTLLSVYGRAWLLVDSPGFSGEVSLERARNERLRPFVRALSPFSVVNWATAPDGRLEWAVIAEEAIVNCDPFHYPERRRRRRLYERHHWYLYEEKSSGIEIIADGANPADAVPLVPVTEPDGYGLDANHWFEDVVRISEAILNNESEAQMNVVKQMFGMLVVSDSFARGAQRAAGRDRTGEGFSATVARSAAVIESVEEKGISRYISPSGVETRMIREENAALKNELYDVVGLAIQGRSREAQTAESKSWDFQNTSQFLAARADLLEQAELRAWELMHRFDPGIPVPEVVYNRKFALRDLEKSIQGLLQLSTINAGSGYRRAVNRTAVELVDAINALSAQEKREIVSEINQTVKEEVHNENQGTD